MWRSLFPDDVSIKADMVELKRKLGKTIRDYYFRKDEVPSEIGISCSYEVHPISVRAMNRLHTVCNDVDNLEPLLRAYLNGEVKILNTRQVLVSNYIDWNIKKLEPSLVMFFFTGAKSDNKLNIVPKRNQTTILPQ
ncbi:hypothetical protein S83_037841 [Arachis hypogaea]